MECAVPCWAERGPCSWSSEEERVLRGPADVPLHPSWLLLLLSERRSARMRSSGGPSRGTVFLQEGLDGERPAELHLAPDVDGSAGRRLGRARGREALRRPAHVLHLHLEGQLREELQQPLEVATHHLGCDLTGVQLPVVPLAVRATWEHWDLRKTKKREKEAHTGCLVTQGSDSLSTGSVK